MKVLSRLLTICCLHLLASFSYADMVIRNNTDLPVTARIGRLCSSIVGNLGIVYPRSSLVVTQHYYDNMGIFCPSSCDADVYVSNNCSGTKIATVNFSKEDGITNIRNEVVDLYAVNGGGFEIVIDKMASVVKPWYKLFF
jgi:hypothetical protein